MNSPHEKSFQPEPFCWRMVGTFGNRECPQLTEHIHCRNCPQYTKAGRQLLNRPVTSGQLADWTKQTAEPLPEVKPGTLSLTVFRLENEWLALPTKCFTEVTRPGPVRRLPGMGLSEVLLGICSLHGEIGLCICLQTLLGLSRTLDVEQSTRFCVIGNKHGDWIFPVSETLGVYRTSEDKLDLPPMLPGMGLSLFSRGVVEIDQHRVGLLDEELVFHALGRSVG